MTKEYLSYYLFYLHILLIEAKNLLIKKYCMHINRTFNLYLILNKNNKKRSVVLCFKS